MNLAASDRNGLSARGGIPSRFVLHVNARIRDGDVIQTDRSGSLRYDLVTLRAFVRCLEYAKTSMVFRVPSIVTGGWRRWNFERADEIASACSGTFRQRLAR